MTSKLAFSAKTVRARAVTPVDSRPGSKTSRLTMTPDNNEARKRQTSDKNVARKEHTKNPSVVPLLDMTASVMRPYDEPQQKSAYREHEILRGGFPSSSSRNIPWGTSRTDKISRISHHTSREGGSPIADPKDFDYDGLSLLDDRTFGQLGMPIEARVIAGKCQQLRKEIQELEEQRRLDEEKHKAAAAYYIGTMTTQKYEPQLSEHMATQTDYSARGTKSEAYKKAVDDNEFLKKINAQYQEEYDEEMKLFCRNIEKQAEEFKKNYQVAAKDHEEQASLVASLAARGKKLQAEIDSVTAQILALDKELKSLKEEKVESPISRTESDKEQQEFGAQATVQDNTKSGGAKQSTFSLEAALRPAGGEKKRSGIVVLVVVVVAIIAAAVLLLFSMKKNFTLF